MSSNDGIMFGPRSRQSLIDNSFLDLTEPLTTIRTFVVDLSSLDEDKSDDEDSMMSHVVNSFARRGLFVIIQDRLNDPRFELLVNNSVVTFH